MIFCIHVKDIKKRSYKKLEFSDNGWIKYEFLMRQKLKKLKHQNINLEIGFWAGFLQIAQ